MIEKPTDLNGGQTATGDIGEHKQRNAIDGITIVTFLAILFTDSLVKLVSIFSQNSR